MDDTKEKMIFLPYVDGAIFSYEHKLMKPDERIYKLLLEKYNLKSDECVFIDDRVENIDSGKRLGIHGIVFENYEQASKELEQLLFMENTK